MNSFHPAYLAERYKLGAPPPVLSEAQAEVRRRILADDHPEHWETCDCLCGATGGRILSEVDRYGLPYRKVLCTRCGLLRVAPRWTEARYADFYAQSYRDLYSPLSARGGDRAVLEQLSRGYGARLIGRFVEEAWRLFGRGEETAPVLIEVGAGGGWNLANAPKHWTRIGYDTDERFLELGKAAFGVELRHGLLGDALPAIAGADCILLSHVLEHVPDPVATLRQLAQAARPEALILVEVPGIFRLHMTSLDPMRYWQNAHTYTFCAKTAADTARRAGLEPLAVDEWTRLVLRPSSMAAARPTDDPRLARSIERYLRFCERAFAAASTVESLPLAGRFASRTVRRGTDASVRLAAALRLVYGMRASGSASFLTVD